MRPIQDHRLTEPQLRFLAEQLRGLSGNGHDVVLMDATTIRRNVHRMSLRGGPTTSVVVKRMWSTQSRLEQRVTERWLPAVGLGSLGPPRLAVFGDPDGLHTWHVYDDLGHHGLDQRDPDPDTVTAAMEAVASLHAAFGTSALLPEPRFAACDMGTYYYVNSVRDAHCSVARLRPPLVDVSAEEGAVRDGVLGLLGRLLEDEPSRVRMLESQAGPETLVHGDLTRANVFVVPDCGHPRVTLIDWDHCGVAPAAFDISTHVAHYEPPERQLVLDAYVAAMAERGFHFPEVLDWELLVSTFEAGRLANQIVWIALGILEGNAWSFTDLSSWGERLAEVTEPASAGLGRPGGA